MIIFDNVDSSGHAREIIIIGNSDVYSSMSIINDSSMTGIKTRISFNTNTFIWKYDTIDNSNCLYTSSDSTIYSLSMFGSTNTLALFIIDASNGSLLQTPYKLNSTISRVSGMVLLPSTLCFIASNNECSIFIIYNLSSKLTISYCFYSQISIFRMGLSYDNNKFIYVGKLNSSPFLSKVKLDQFSYYSFTNMNSYAMINASSEITYSTMSTSTLISQSVSYVLNTISLQSFILYKDSSLNSDISLNCESISSLSLAQNALTNISIDLSCSVDDTSSISYSIETLDGSSLPNWISLDAINRILIVNTIGVTAGTKISLSIISASTYPICNKAVNLKIVDCDIQNCTACEYNNKDSCQLCNNEYYLYNESNTTNRICKKYDNSSSSVSKASSTATQSAVGIAMGATLVFSFCNLSTIQGIWISLNQFQLILLLLLTNSQIPKSIVDYLSGLKTTTCSLNFIPFKDIPGFKSIVDSLNYEVQSKTLDYFGVFSGSTFVNNLSFICVFVIIMLSHLSFCVIKYIFRKCIQKRQKLSDIKNKIHQFLMLSIYIRLIFQVNQFLMLCSFSEIKAWNISSTSRITSLATAFIGALICNAFILLSLFYWIRNRNTEKIEENLFFREFSNNIKDKSKPRFYSTVSLLRREVFVVFLIMASSLSSVWIVAPMIVVQAFYLASLIYIRPYKSIKDNLLEIINESYYFVLVSLLSHFNSDSKWISVAENAYFCIIIANSFTICIIMITSIIFQMIIKAKQKCKRNKVGKDKPIHEAVTEENKAYEFKNFRFVMKHKSSSLTNKSNLSHATSDIQLNEIKYSVTKDSNSHSISKNIQNSKLPPEESKIAQYWSNYYQMRKPRTLNE